MHSGRGASVLRARDAGRLEVGPVPAEDRLVAIDLLRGLALLGIALANVPSLLWSAPRGIGFHALPQTAGVIDRMASGLIVVGVERTTMPVFAMLLGWGIGVVLARTSVGGVARRVVLRRGLFLMALGLMHGVLLFDGDILMLFGATTIAVLACARLQGRRILVIACCAAVVGSALTGATEALLAYSAPGPDIATALAALADRSAAMATDLVILPILLTTTLPSALAGLWCSRTGALEVPRITGRGSALGVTGLAVGALSAVPIAGAVSGLWVLSRVDVGLWAAVQTAGGMLGAVLAVPMLVHLCGRLALAPKGRWRHRFTHALAAAGARSMSCYLLQSVLLVVPLSAWAGGLGGGFGAAGGVVWALAAGVSVTLAAALMAGLGARGPAESLIRCVAYARKPPVDAPASTTH